MGPSSSTPWVQSVPWKRLGWERGGRNILLPIWLRLAKGRKAPPHWPLGGGISEAWREEDPGWAGAAPFRLWERAGGGACGRRGRRELGLGLGPGMPPLGSPVGLGLWPRDGERAGGGEGPASQQEVSLGRRRRRELREASSGLRGARAGGSSRDTGAGTSDSK